jgi:purine-nucleoside phosphorylase
MPQIHLHAEAGDYAPLVLLPGDPTRARRIAERFDGGLENVRQVNANRGLFGFTGRVDGRPVSVQTTGMGTPSMAIVAEELMRLGARQLVRVGTAGALRADMRVGDLVIATASSPADGTTRAFLDGRPYAPAADFALTHALVHAAERLEVPFHVGPIASMDVFSHYHPDPDFVRPWRNAGTLAVEMESSALFYMAAAHLHERRAAQRRDGPDDRRGPGGRLRLAGATGPMPRSAPRAPCRPDRSRLEPGTTGR